MDVTKPDPKYLDSLKIECLQYDAYPLYEGLYRLGRDLQHLLREPMTGRTAKKVDTVITFMNRITTILAKRRAHMGKYRSRIQQQWAFANVRLTKEQRLAFAVWVEELVNDVIEVLTIVLLEGYKFSLKWDKENESWIATLTGDETNKSNAYTSMSGRHSEPELAILVLLYKHLEICAGGVWEEAAEDSDWG